MNGIRSVTSEISVWKKEEEEDDDDDEEEEEEEVEEVEEVEVEVEVELEVERTNEVYLPKNKRVYNGRLPVEAEAHESWPPTKKF